MKNSLVEDKNTLRIIKKTYGFKPFGNFYNPRTHKLDYVKDFKNFNNIISATSIYKIWVTKDGERTIMDEYDGSLKDSAIDIEKTSSGNAHKDIVNIKNTDTSKMVYCRIPTDKVRSFNENIKTM